MNILGISAFYHDSAAALLVDGEIIAAAQEERFSRIKNDESFPEKAIEYCLRQGNLKIENLDYVVFYEKPLLKVDRVIENYLNFIPAFISFSKAIPKWLKEKLWIRDFLQDWFKNQPKILFTEHHISHGASAFFPSPYSRSAVVTCDGVGEWATTSVGVGDNGSYRIIETINYPHSLGLLYSAFTYFTGFKINSGEYKLMGLAPYGEPRYADLIRNHLIKQFSDGSFQLNMKYFSFPHSLVSVGGPFESLLNVKRRIPEGPLRQVDCDLAASIQRITEEVMLGVVNRAYTKVGGDNLCLAGGVALNCVSNQKLLEQGPFKNIWIQPAAGDAGAALGAALYVHHVVLNNPKKTSSVFSDSLKGSYLGPDFNEATIQVLLESHKIPYQKIADEDQLTMKVAKLISEEKIVGWFQGRMEFGPRALGNRSILANPLSVETQTTVNLKIKFRESFRPFAPSVRLEDVSEYFECQNESPYMTFVSQVSKKCKVSLTDEEKRITGLDKLKIKRSSFPAVTHVDYTARLQTVRASDNPLFHKLLTKFKEITGFGLLVNTSLNVRGEPMVCDPKDAVQCFLKSGLDYLVLGSFLLKKTDMVNIDFKISNSESQPLD